MTTFGLTTQGFTPKRLEDILASVEVELRAELGDDLDFSDTSMLKQICGPVAIEIAQVWEAAQSLYDSFSPDTASGAALDNVCSLTGTQREQGKVSTVVLTLTGTPKTLIESGKVVSDTSGQTWETTQTVEIGGDGTATVTAQASDVGEISADANTITSINTPVTGWDEVTNAAEAIVGRSADTDAELRLRREAELVRGGAGTVGALRSALQDIESVQDAIVFTNRTNETDANGLPPHSFQAILYPNTASPDDIATTLFTLSSFGHTPHGSQVYNVEDSEGFNQIQRWEWANPITREVSVTITRGAGYPADGETQVQKAITSAWSFGIGDDVLVFKLLASLTSIPGITDVSITIEGSSAGQNQATAYDTIKLLGAINVTEV